MMEEITEENIDAFVNEALSQSQPEHQELLKDCMAFAVRFQRDDLVGMILEKSIRQNRLIEKLQDYGLKTQTLIPFLSNDDEDFDDESDSGFNAGSTVRFP
jgi:hypothetical protein